MQRHSRSKNYFEGLPQEELVNKLAQLLWYARQPNVDRSWKSLGKNDKAVYRRLANIMIQETRFRIDELRAQIARERWEERNEKRVPDPTGELIGFEEIDEHEFLGIRRATHMRR